MGRHATITDEQLSDARRLLGAGKTQGQVAKLLGINQCTLSRALKRTGGRRLTVSAATPPATDDGTEAPAKPPAIDLGELRGIVGELIRETAGATRAARGDPELQAKLTRLTTALGQLAKSIVEPAPPADPNEAPDMVAAAERGRAKLRDYLERLRRGEL